MATTRVRWTRLALDDSGAARAWYEGESREAWPKLAAQVRAAVSRLRRHPGCGTLVPERRAQGYRELVLSPYRLVYSVSGKEIFILRFWHSRRDPAGLG